MKHVSISKVIGMLLFLTCCFTNFNAFAHTPHACEIHGVIQSIDYQKRTLTLSQTEEHDPRKVIWKSNTQFLLDSRNVNATKLVIGTHVTIYYHAPFFGKPFATKIIWSTP